MSINQEYLKLVHQSWRVKLAIVILAVGLVLPGLYLPKHKSLPMKADLLHGHDWSDFAGAKQTPAGMAITPLARKIVHQDGSGGQPNPSVNLAGPELLFGDNVTLDATMRNFQTGDSLQIYGGVPIIYDEWRYEPPSAQFTLASRRLDINLWDGTSYNPARAKRFVFTAKNLSSLSLTRYGNKLTIVANGKKLGSINSQPVFTAGRLWFGASAGINSPSWTLTTLVARSPTKTLQVNNGLSWGKQSSSKPSLQSLAAAQPHPIQIGAAVALNPLLSDGRYRSLALSQFDIWTPENELKPQFIHPQPDVYSFQEADLLVNTALKNGIAVHGHALVFGEANPRWMQIAPPAARQQIMIEHITTAVTHFKGRIHEWDVINEPLSDNDEDYANGGNGLRHHIWYQAMGKSYVATALQAAHSADPSAKLYINDYGLEADGERWTAMISLIKQLQSQNVPLNGIGFESHVYDNGDHIDPAILERHMQQLARMGLVSRISEIDVHGENRQYQAQEYNGVLKACLREPSCVAFSTWGITDKYGSTTDTNVYPLSYGDDLLWDSSLRNKPAYSQLMKTLQSTSIKH